MDQQLYKFQKYETILWSEMTVCTPGETSVLHVTVQRGKMAVSLSPREMTVLELDLSLRFKQVSHPGIYRMKEEDLFLYCFSSSPSPNVARAALVLVTILYVS